MLKDSFVTFDAHMRKRWADYEEVLSPSFDRWDGYRVIVPEGTEWSAAIDGTVKDHAYGSIWLDGMDVLPCPFCARAPHLHGVHRDGKYTYICAAPFDYTVWWLECCEWARTPHVDNLLKMVADRNAKLSALHRPAVSVERLRALVAGWDAEAGKLDSLSRMAMEACAGDLRKVIGEESGSAAAERAKEGR